LSDSEDGKAGQGSFGDCMRVLITGGAGFIGSHLADALVDQGHQVVILDILHPQVHGTARKEPDYLNPQAELVKGDVRNDDLLNDLLSNTDVVFHLASYTGVGQSMYQIQDYLDVNVLGTATLLQVLSENQHNVRKLIVASSRAVYGEGAYRCEECGLVAPSPRSADQLQCGEWGIKCPDCGHSVRPIPTAEDKPLDPGSIYAVSKMNQEQACLVVGQAYDLQVVALRYFNVYGPRQSLRNPYTGVIATFITRLMNGKPPEVYEDGRESRDFVHVSDVVQATLLAMQKEEANGQILNVGSGKRLSLLEIAEIVAAEYGGSKPIITGKFRVGDIRHCYANLTRSQQILGYKPEVTFEEGIRDIINRSHYEKSKDCSSIAEEELRARGLASQARI
jgi:dTDP-L-rhamnose 4-epimerase